MYMPNSLKKEIPLNSSQQTQYIIQWGLNGCEPFIIFYISA